MSLKREADPFIKPDPDAKRVKTEGGDGYFSLASIPMAPRPATFASSTSSAIAPKTEGGDRKPLGPVPSFGGNPEKSNRKKKFVGNTIRAQRGDEWVSAHFNRRAMVVNFVMHCRLTKQWPSVQVEQEIFERLNKAKFDVQPSEGWGFLDRKFRAHFDRSTVQPASAMQHYQCEVNVQNLSAKKLENSPSYFKKEEQFSKPKSERSG